MKCFRLFFRGFIYLSILSFLFTGCNTVVVDSDLLVEENGKFYYNNELFEGLSQEFYDNNKLKYEVNYSNGEIIESNFYSYNQRYIKKSKYIESKPIEFEWFTITNESVVKIPFSRIKVENDVILFQNKPFSGILYSVFDSNIELNNSFKEIVFVEEGKVIGPYFQYFNNGELKSEMNFKYVEIQDSYSVVFEKNKGSYINNLDQFLFVQNQKDFEGVLKKSFQGLDYGSDGFYNEDKLQSLILVGPYREFFESGDPVLKVNFDENGRFLGESILYSYSHGLLEEKSRIVKYDSLGENKLVFKKYFRKNIIQQLEYYSSKVLVKEWKDWGGYLNKFYVYSSDDIVNPFYGNVKLEILKFYYSNRNPSIVYDPVKVENNLDRYVFNVYHESSKEWMVGFNVHFDVNEKYLLEPDLLDDSIHFELGVEFGGEDFVWNSKDTCCNQDVRNFIFHELNKFNSLEVNPGLIRREYDGFPVVPDDFESLLHDYSVDEYGYKSY